MKISARCEYACRAILELALHQSNDQPLTAMTIAENRCIPEKYLVHILLQLKNSGLVRSIRGAQGGYLLARMPHEISLLDILRSIDGPVLDPLPVDDATTADMKPTWRSVAADIEDVLRDQTIEDILASAQGTAMYHI